MRRDGDMRSMRNKTVRVCLLIALLLFSMHLFAVSSEAVRDLLTETTVRIDTVDEEGEIISYGSGFFFAENGLICTNFHVIEDYFRESLSLSVLDGSGKSYDAYPVVWNATRDWAVIQIPNYYSEWYLGMGSEVELLDDIWDAGFPVTGNLKITSGSVSSYQPDFMDSGLNFYDVSMKFDPGNSGGPVINDDLEVIGIAVAYYTEARDMDFIIPMAEILDELYWARYITGSTAFVPSYISGEEAEDAIYITNDTGYEIVYLYILDDEMIDSDDWGIDYLGDFSLPVDEWIPIYPSSFQYIQDQIDAYFGMLTILAIDEDNDMYVREWFPGLDSWDIIMTFDDYVFVEYDEYEVMEGFLHVTNYTGYPFEALYITSESDLQSGNFTDNLLGNPPLEDWDSLEIDMERYSFTESQADLLYLVARDTDGDYYIRNIIPSSTEITIDFDDYVALPWWQDESPSQIGL